MRRALAHRGNWSIWVREWLCHQVDRWIDRRIRSGKAGWFTEDWLLRQHRRRFGMAAFVRSDYGLEPSPDPAAFLARPAEREPSTVGFGATSTVVVPSAG